MVFINAVNANQQGMQYFSSLGAWSGVDGGSAGQVLTSNGTGVAASFQSSSATTGFTTDSGSANPTSGNINILGGPGVTVDASGDTITINSVVWTERGASVTVPADSGTFDVSGGTATFTLPAAPSQGEECRFVCINSGGIVRANTGQVISIGSANSTPGGTATSTAGSDALWLTYNAGTLRWFTVAREGTWTLA